MPKRVSDLLAFENSPSDDARCIRVTLKPSSKRSELARLVAIEAVRRLTAPVEDAFDRWLESLHGKNALDETEKATVLSYVGADFLDPDNTTRLEGSVAEHLWASIADSLDGGWGRPVHVEHDHFSVIDHGPDGLSVYDVGGQDLGFRLWESKRHASKRQVTRTITRAAEQLRSHGAEYLARISKVLQTNSDSRVAGLGGTIVREWVEESPNAAVGVSVGRSPKAELPRRPFKGLRREFAFGELERREVVLIEVPKFGAFSRLVRDVVLTGLI